jgi:hypothetical protein
MDFQATTQTTGTRVLPIGNSPVVAQPRHMHNVVPVMESEGCCSQQPQLVIGANCRLRATDLTVGSRESLSGTSG